MDVILIGIDRLDEERRIFLARGIEAFLEGGFDVGFQPFSAIFGAPDDVILQLVGAVVERFCLHATSLRFRSGFHSSPGTRASHTHSIPFFEEPAARGFLENKKTLVRVFDGESEYFYEVSNFDRAFHISSV